MPRGSKRKRDEGDEPDPPPRQSGRQRKKKSFGTEFEEEWSPPRGTKNPTPQQPKATANKPGPSSALIHLLKRILYLKQRTWLLGLPMKSIGSNCYQLIIVSASIIFVRGLRELVSALRKR